MTSICTNRDVSSDRPPRPPPRGGSSSEASLESAPISCSALSLDVILHGPCLHQTPLMCLLSFSLESLLHRPCVLKCWWWMATSVRFVSPWYGIFHSVSWDLPPHCGHRSILLVFYKHCEIFHRQTIWKVNFSVWFDANIYECEHLFGPSDFKSVR